ncbi:MAG: thymidine phosphorylase [bacterium]
MRLFYEIIADKRDGIKLSDRDITYFLDSYLNGSLSDYQMSAMLMAIFFKGLDSSELATWTKKMLFSGEVLDFSNLDGPVVDKHSTGGVGDKISIPLAPLLAELGFNVPMISGRGLGHTGGTLDKLESIPGFSVNIDKEDFCRIIKKNKMLLIGQTPQIAPLDKKLYALRDVTGTVESIPLIASSIMSKKLAEGISGLILDIKIGVGAFMKTLESGKLLAEAMKQIGAGFSTKVEILFTEMSEPLGFATGNALEVIESIDVMKGKYVPQVTELVVKMAAMLMTSFKMCNTVEEGEEIALKKLQSGDIAERFRKTVELQGGNADVVDNPLKILPASKFKKEIYAQKAGYIESINPFLFGKALVQLGGGRLKKEDSINYGTGFIFNKKRGDKVVAGDLLYTVYYDDCQKLDVALKYLEEGVTTGDEKPPDTNLILGSW